MRHFLFHKTALQVLAGVALSASLAGAQAPQLPNAPLMVRAKQKPSGEWKEYPTRTLQQLPQIPAVTATMNRFGGWANAPWNRKATGFFQSEKVNGRWWLLDPEGKPFFNAGVATVNVGRTPGITRALDAKFGGDRAKWAQSATQMLRENGFNGAGAWTDWTNLRAVQNPLPYTRISNFMSEYGKKRGGTYQQAGHIGYPDNLVFVFDAEFATFCDEYAKTLADTRDDPFLLGHFSDNELPFPTDALDRSLKHSETDPNGREARAWIAKRGKTIETITDEDRRLFVGHMVDTYLRLTTSAIRKVDPNHLMLGPRFHGSNWKQRELWRAAGRHLDVVAFNYYGQWTPNVAQMKDWDKWSDKPFLVTEWYVKGMDAGLANTGGAGWVVPTQRERGQFYQNFALGLLEARNCVGWHWFKYMDNDPEDLKADPSNRDSNKGIMSIGLEPYQPLLTSMRDLNVRVYDLITAFDKPKP